MNLRRGLERYNQFGQFVAHGGLRSLLSGALRGFFSHLSLNKAPTWLHMMERQIIVDFLFEEEEEDSQPTMPPPELEPKRPSEPFRKWSFTPVLFSKTKQSPLSLLLRQSCFLARLTM